MKRKMVRCADCLRHNDALRTCDAGEKGVWFNSDRVAKARRYCSAFYPKCAWVESGNVLVHTTPIELHDGKEWITAPRRVLSPWNVH